MTLDKLLDRIADAETSPGGMQTLMTDGRFQKELLKTAMQVNHLFTLVADSAGKPISDLTAKDLHEHLHCGTGRAQVLLALADIAKGKG